MQPKTQTSAGMETAAQTVERAKAMMAGMGSTPTPTTPTPSQSQQPNPILEALTSRLIQQGQGISTSASSEVQSTINQAIADTQRAGDLTRERLQSERGREMGFAQDRASATYTGALEERTGYATQTVALRELVETTDKSIRDLDKRYQESIILNDSETAKTLASLRLEKLKFLQEQEQNYFNNLISVGGLQEQQTAREQENERFLIETAQRNDQFMKTMKQSDDQFTKNLALQYEDLNLKEQELGLSRQRNQISMMEYNAKINEINREKEVGQVSARIFSDIKNQIVGLGQSPEDINATDYALYAYEEYRKNGANQSVAFEDFLVLAETAKDNMIVNGVMPPATSSGSRSGGILGGSASVAGQFFGPLTGKFADLWLGKKQ